MGEYVYRVTKNLHKCSDGEMAHVAIFAYKPVWCDIKLNEKMHFRSGATASDRMAEENRLRSNRIVMGKKDDDGKITGYPDSQVFENETMIGSFSDIFLGKVDYLRVIHGVKS